MSDISISGTLILNGDIQTSGNVRLESGGLLIPVLRNLSEAIYSCPTKSLKYENGRVPTITSTESDISFLSDSTVYGVGKGFPANRGPGANSALLDNNNDPSNIFGANHAGIGAVFNVPGSLEMIEEQYIINNINLFQGGIDLTYEPLNGILAVNIVHGPSQSPGVDYELLGDFISWTGLALESLLSVGDVLRVLYLADTARNFPSPLSTYGSYLAPTSAGSGSGETAGGSGLHLIARSGSINLNGVINISGESASSIRSGGASGGSFWATAWNLTGGGSITADGGDATYVYAGGGGGGYITLNYENQNNFSGELSVVGHKSGTHGIKNIEKIEPFFIEKFTGTLLNPKWWTVADASNSITVNNMVYMDSSTGDWSDPRIESKFEISGKTIKVDCDFIPSGIEPSFHTSYFQLFVDSRNWVSVAKKKNYIFGMYSVDGFLSQDAVLHDYTNTTFRILKSDSTYTFQYIDSTPITIFSDVIPELENRSFKVAIGFRKEEPDASNYVSDYFKLTNVNEADGYVTLSGVPIDSSDVSLNVIGGTSQLYGVDYTVVGQTLTWIPPNLVLNEGDEIVAQYANDTTFNELHVAWDNFKVYNGILKGIQSSEPILYVDPVYGSDSSDGRALSPLKTLFVATAWAKPNSKIILYNGSHDPTEIINKTLTIQGAYGATPVITTLNVQDTTGSNWENSCLTFRKCSGLVQNVRFTSTDISVYGERVTDLEINNCQFADLTTGIKIETYSSNCRVIGNTFNNVDLGISFDGQMYSPYIYSNVMYDSSIGISFRDTSNFIVSSNTLDFLNLGLITDNSSVGYVASNNFTYSSQALLLNGDSTTGLFNNNFFGTPIISSGTGIISDDSNNIIADPAYYNQALRNYHILSFSSDRSAGTDIFDVYCLDKDGVRRLASPGYDIGAYQSINVSHGTLDFYVDTSGEDWNAGTVYSPFRTLDKAMSVANKHIRVSSVLNYDTTTAIAVGGRYDSYYLNLASESIYFVDASKRIQTFAIESNYSNINLGSTMFVSPSGSDGTAMGGDGTDTGGNGSLQKPFRTIGKALEASSPNSYIIVFSGDYPLFDGTTNRVLVPFNDRTGIPDGRMYLEDTFSTPNAMYPGHNVAEPLLWTLTADASSEAFIQEGYLSMSYDGTHPVSAESTFQFVTGDNTAFEVTAELRQAFDPIYFRIYNADNTATFKYYNGDYTSTLVTGGESYNCWGTLITPTDMTFTYFTDYICVSSEDIQNKYVSLSYVLKDTTNVSVNIVGGTPQEFDVDFYVRDSKILWDGYGLDGEIMAGDVLRVIYIAEGLSDPAKIKFILKDNALTVLGIKNGHFTRLTKKALHSDPTGSWNASFFMDSTMIPGVYGRGYVSKFLAISESFANTEKAKPYEAKTWRQPIIIRN